MKLVHPTISSNYSTLYVIKKKVVSIMFHQIQLFELARNLVLRESISLSLCFITMLCIIDYVR